MQRTLISRLVVVVFHCPTCSLQYMNILFDIVRLLFQPICPPLDWSIDLSRLTKIADHYQTPTVASRLCCRAALFVPVLLNAKSKARLFNTIRIIKRRFLIQSLSLFRRARVELRSYSDWFGKYPVTSDLALRSRGLRAPPSAQWTARYDTPVEVWKKTRQI